MFHHDVFFHRPFGLVAGEKKVVIFKIIISSAMDKNNSPKSCRENLKPEKISKSFQDISKYFSKEEWLKLTKWQKSAYVYMKRNYIRMSSLGVTVNLPVFMRGKEQAGESLLSGKHKLDEGSQSRSQVNPQRHRLCEGKKTVIYEELSDSEED
uniref:Protein SSXA1-like n=1 Tax=Nannospalax galili TaxID=1026970 RepID=A0A8C6RKQ7_NANGA